MNEIEEISFVMLAFSRINYIQIKRVNYMEAQLLVELIFTLTKDEHYHLLQLFCFSIPTADNNMVKKLEAIIIGPDLFWNFTVKRVVDHIYIYWK